MHEEGGPRGRHPGEPAAEFRAVAQDCLGTSIGSQVLRDPRAGTQKRREYCRLPPSKSTATSASRASSPRLVAWTSIDDQLPRRCWRSELV